MMPCHACKCAALLHTMPAVDSTLTDARTSPRALSTFWQVGLSAVIFPVNEAKVEEWQVDELALPDAADLGSVTRTDKLLRLVARAHRLPPPFASH